MLARKIQQSMMPSSSLWDKIEFLYYPVDKVGGDFLDFVRFREQELVGIFLCDVSGHGLSAGFVTTFIKHLILESGKYKLNPKDLLCYLNYSLFEKTAGHFITAFYGVYNLNTKKFIYSNAGHNPPYLIKENSVSKLEFDSLSLPLAIFNNEEHFKKNVSYKNYEITIEKDTRLFLYTDGLIGISKISDDTIRTDENFIINMLKKFNNEKDNKVFLHRLFSEIENFRQDKYFEDDITMIILS